MARYSPSIDDGSNQRRTRTPARHARPADPADAAARLDAWLRDRPAPPRDVGRRPASGRELAVSRIATAARQWVDQRRVGIVRQQSPRALLLADGGGPQASDRRAQGI